ncbi:PFL_4703 family integrating conjugative element protein [Nitrogeniibacter aestuarii]|uniref:PFL_4703 family integrating conjugative element protein n=1 Tax=Nitrogeniibacter aestuarii TaxID=2815343 RepID=UPI001E448BBA|nr:TIGR03746 family integrating conjugative element protein [Nitrogeniibacter aestuarii]
MSFTNIAKSQHAEIVFYRWVLAGLLGLSMLLAVFWRAQQTEFIVHVPPDLSNGAALAVGTTSAVPSPNVYLFGFYILQQLNRWPKDGSTEAGERIFSLQNYLTPSCRQYLIDDMHRKTSRGELARRTRALQAIPGFGFAPNRVLNHGSGGWTVLIDAQLTETTNGVPVKDTFIRYPLHVVRYDVDREQNPWQLALNCYGGREPERLSQDALDAAAANSTPEPRGDLLGATEFKGAQQ